MKQAVLNLCQGNGQLDTNYDVGNEIIYNWEVINPKVYD